MVARSESRRSFTSPPVFSCITRSLRQGHKRRKRLSAERRPERHAPLRGRHGAACQSIDTGDCYHPDPDFNLGPCVPQDKEREKKKKEKLERPSVAVAAITLLWAEDLPMPSSDGEKDGIWLSGTHPLRTLLTIY